MTLNLVAMGSADPRVTPAFVGGLDLAGYAGCSFDIVYSNAAMEHVGSLQNQHQMAAEKRRIGLRSS